MIRTGHDANATILGNNKMDKNQYNYIMKTTTTAGIEREINFLNGKIKKGGGGGGVFSDSMVPIWYLTMMLCQPLSW